MPRLYPNRGMVMPPDIGKDAATMSTALTGLFGRTGLFALALALALALFRLLIRHRALVRGRVAAIRGWFVPALGLGAVAVFAEIAEAVQERETTDFDRAVSLGLHNV